MTENDGFRLDQHLEKYRQYAETVHGITIDEKNTEAKFCRVCARATAHHAAVECVSCYAMARARLKPYD